MRHVVRIDSNAMNWILLLVATAIIAIALIWCVAWSNTSSPLSQHVSPSRSHSSQLRA